MHAFLFERKMFISPNAYLNIIFSEVNFYSIFFFMNKISKRNYGKILKVVVY